MTTTKQLVADILALAAQEMDQYPNEETALGVGEMLADAVSGNPLRVAVAAAFMAGVKAAAEAAA